MSDNTKAFDYSAKEVVRLAAGICAAYVGKKDGDNVLIIAGATQALPFGMDLISIDSESMIAKGANIVSTGGIVYIAADFWKKIKSEGDRRPVVMIGEAACVAYGLLEFKEFLDNRTDETKDPEDVTPEDGQ